MVDMLAQLPPDVDNPYTLMSSLGFELRISTYLLFIVRI